MEVFKDGAWRTPVNAEAYIGGKWRTLKYVEGYIGEAWRRIATFVLPPTLSVDPGSGASSPANPMTTGNVTATPTNGLAPFSYAWTLVGSIGVTGVTINSPSAAATTLTATVIGPVGSSGTATVRCTATDVLGEAATDTAEVSFENSQVHDH